MYRARDENCYAVSMLLLYVLYAVNRSELAPAVCNPTHSCLRYRYTRCESFRVACLPSRIGRGSCACRWTK